MIGRILRGLGRRAPAKTFDLTPHPQARTERFGYATAPGGAMHTRDYLKRLMGLAAIGGAAGGAGAAGQFIYDRETRRATRKGDQSELMRKALEAEMRASVARARYAAFLATMHEQVSGNNNMAYEDDQEGMP